MMKQYKDFNEMFADNTQYNSKAVFNGYMELMPFTKGVNTYCKINQSLTPKSYKMILTPSFGVGFVHKACKVIDEVRNTDPEWAEKNLSGCSDTKYLLKLFAPHTIYETKPGKGGAEYDNVEVYYWDGGRKQADIEVLGNTDRADNSRKYHRGKEMLSLAPFVGVGRQLDDFCPALYSRIEDIIRNLCDEIKIEYDKLEHYYNLAQEHRGALPDEPQYLFLEY